MDAIGAAGENAGMKLHQLALNYVATEDRLLLRASREDGQEYQCWLTRRLVKALLPGLGKLLHSDPGVAADPVVGAEKLAFQHAAAVQRNQFKPEFTAGELAPECADGPMLVQRMQMRRGESGSYQLNLAAQDGPAIHLGLSETLMHGFLRLLQQALRTSEWDLNPRVVPDVAQAPAPGAVAH